MPEVWSEPQATRGPEEGTLHLLWYGGHRRRGGDETEDAMPYVQREREARRVHRLQWKGQLQLVYLDSGPDRWEHDYGRLPLR